MAHGTPVGAVLAVLFLLATPALAAEPVLSRVTLSSGGVAQYEFTAEVDGAATLPLDVPLDQVDDLLKSLRVDDAAGLPSLRMPGREPLGESFRPLPFRPDAFASTEALLGALVGEGVRLPSGAAGRVLAVTAEETVLPQGAGTLTRHRLTIATATGIETAVLEDTAAIELTSDTLRAQIAAALAAIAQARVQDRRTAQLSLATGGPRTVRFGYVTPAPVWKTSYRLTIAAEGDTARLQAFAVVENLSGRAWQDVTMVLTSGQPVLYHQPLYEAVFTTRPEAPVEVANRLTPRLDEGAGPIAAPRPAGMPLPAPMRAASAAEMAPAAAPPAPPPPAEARESVAQVEFTLGTRISAASGETLMLPILDRPVPARRVALYQPGAPNPLVALLLHNDGAGAWPPGLATLFERQADQAGFIGDARLPAVQPGEDRLASFAADLAVQMSVAQEGDALITSGRAARGVLELLRQERAVTTYRVTTPATAGRTILIDHPKREGWTLAEPAEGVAETRSAYRITRTIGPGTTEAVPVVLERPRSERITLTDLAIPRLLALSQEGRLTPELRAAMARAAQLRAELDRRTQVVAGLRDRRDAIVADQDRIRQNLAAVPAQSELQRRYLQQMQQQETELAAIATQDAAARRAVVEAEAALRDAVLGAS